MGLRVVVPDLPGHGQSTIEATSPDSLTESVIALTKCLKVSPSSSFHLVGHSLGAIVAAQVAEELLERTASLTLISPAGLGRQIASDFVHGMASVQTTGELTHLLGFLGPRANTLSDDMLKMLTTGLAKGRLLGLASDVCSSSGAQRLDILRRLERISSRLSVSLYMGLQDKVIPFEQAQNVPAHVAVHWLSESGHMPMYDQPRLIFELLTSGPLKRGRNG